MVRREYCYGIYRYTDKENGEIVYIGKDSHIDKNLRHIEHFQPCKYDNQPINRILQNNPDRYEYSVWYHVSNIKELNQLEFDLINLYRPKFNFQHGGGGGPINKKFKYSVVKAGIEPTTGDQRYGILSKEHNWLIQSIDYDSLQEIELKLNKGETTPEQVKKMKRNYKQSLESNIKRSKSQNSTGFFRVRKMGANNAKHGFVWVYDYYDENIKQKKISRVNLFDLRDEVVTRGMDWVIVNEQKAKKTLENL